MGHQLNLVGAQLALRVLRGELTAEEANKELRSSKPFHPGKCEPGLHGICVKHGQSLSDCQEDDE